jgi:hypothetical protein
VALAVAFTIVVTAAVHGQGRARGTEPVPRASGGHARDRWERLGEVCTADSDPVGARVLHDYGAIFAAANSVTPPPVCVFSSEADVSAFQASLSTKKSRIGGVEIELQTAAMDALHDAIDQASGSSLRITPRGGSIAAKRSFADTLRLWNSRFIPGLDHWVARGRIKKKDADAVREMPLVEQMRQVLEWESEGMFFSTGRNRPIMTSVALPGASQHLSLLALDVEQAPDTRVRRILNQHGWFQTVVDDSPHFTFLGLDEGDLPARGLRRVARGGFEYWVPAL